MWPWLSWAGLVRGHLSWLQSGCRPEPRSAASLKGQLDLPPKRLPCVAGKSVLSPVLSPFAAESVAATALGQETRAWQSSELEGAWAREPEEPSAAPAVHHDRQTYPRARGTHAEQRRCGPHSLPRALMLGCHSNLSGESKSGPGPLAPSLGCILLSRKRRGKVSQAQMLKPEDPGPGGLTGDDILKT